MSPAPTAITRPLCELCHQFTSNLFAFDFARQDSYPPRWQSMDSGWTPERAWGDGFRHHETFQDLSESAKTCNLCNVLYADLAPMDSALHQGWLGLYPWWSAARMGENTQKGHFRAGFRESLAKMPWGSSKIGSVPLHSFKVCRRGPLREGEEVTWLDAHRRFSAIPTTIGSSDISRAVARWQQVCSKDHKNCAEGKSDQELPTRVIDLGENEAARIRLIESNDEKAPYAALSHCWGGVIPAITTEANKTARSDGMDSDELPQNFKDAIHVARALGIRYLWIDALCIIQDSKADWFREAGRMSSVYSGASVVISALDSEASTAGFLKPDRLLSAELNDEYAIQKVFPEIDDYLEACPLVGRGWCMQERLLANPILHFGKEQMFWECQSEFACEDGKKYTGESDGHAMAKFVMIRKRIGVSAANGTQLEWDAWYQLLEEYTTRKFTVSSDKLPALAGAATLLKSTRPGATYVAGLWKEDIVRGLLWCAHYYHMPGRKVWGISLVDKISELTKPPAKRAPSWSWASLDGQLDFWALRTKGFVVEVLDVAMSAGENELTEALPDGTIKLRGLVARMFYHPPPDEPGRDVGILTFGEADSLDDKSVTLHGCVMDVDRRSPRFCSVVIMSQSNGNIDWYLLVLDECDDGSYMRIGMCTAHNVHVDPKRFETTDILII
ncbi:HET-domain-containing protein [Hypoxylon crocopeplum]|nr:HET-domain-containing protein [Hypoxylon crocopeplum]